MFIFCVKTELTEKQIDFIYNQQKVLSKKFGEESIQRILIETSIDTSQKNSQQNHWHYQDPDKNYHNVNLDTIGFSMTVKAEDFNNEEYFKQNILQSFQYALKTLALFLAPNERQKLWLPSSKSKKDNNDYLGALKYYFFEVLEGYLKEMYERSKHKKTEKGYEKTGLANEEGHEIIFHPQKEDGCNLYFDKREYFNKNIRFYRYDITKTDVEYKDNGKFLDFSIKLVRHTEDKNDEDKTKKIERKQFQFFFTKDLEKNLQEILDAPNQAVKNQKVSITKHRNIQQGKSEISKKEHKKIASYVILSCCFIVLAVAIFSSKEGTEGEVSALRDIEGEEAYYHNQNDQNTNTTNDKEALEVIN